MECKKKKHLPAPPTLSPQIHKLI